MQFITFIQEHYNDILALFGAAVAFCSIAVKLTPSTKDDAILAKVVKILDHLSIFNPKK